jgi:protein-disulfide isomerase
LDKMDAQYQQQRLKAVEVALDAILRDKVLLAEAQRTGKTIDQLLAAEAEGGTFEPTPVEIGAWYEENKSRVQGRTLEQLSPQIADFLRTKKKKDASVKLQARLNKDRQVVVHFEPYRAQLNNEGAPVFGNASSNIVLTEFSDFECPFCSRFYPTLKRLEETHGKQIKIVYRQYPIPSLHASAFKAAEASLCANDQGKFWELHDRMFTDQTKLGVRDIKESAGALGMDRAKFDACLDSGKYTERVQEDIKEAQRAGVTGTPALFVNGVPIEGGAVSYEAVVAALEKEMARAKK